MRIARIKIDNFRGIASSDLLLPAHAVLIGDNNTGKTTILEAIDLVLGPDRLNRTPPIDEHDFYQGQYLKTISSDKHPDVEPEDAVDMNTISSSASPRIEIEVTVVDLSSDQKARFGEHVEFWDSGNTKLYTDAIPAGVDSPHILEALRVTFRGWYDEEEDDFEGKTYLTRSLEDGNSAEPFTKKDKQICGFLYLRSIRTGSRALSLERGSLLDIILRLKEVRPQMWEDTIKRLSDVSIAGDASLGISPVLESINSALKKYVPKEWGVEPHLKVSNLTREGLRQVITAFVATGEGIHSAPFYRQGTGTINMLVLAMLSQIAESKQNVIFAMEEPETAIPPYAQKRIIHEVRKLASQTLFTSHSPYVLEEFPIEETIVLSRNTDSVLSRRLINLPQNIKLKRYRQDFRTRFCEGLLARRVLIAEGATEASVFPAVARRLSELNPERYSSLEALGICTIDADGETNIPGMAELYRDIGKRVFAICDKQDDTNRSAIENQVDLLLMHEEKGIENLVLINSSEDALKRFSSLIEWPQHLKERYPEPEKNIVIAMKDYFSANKANWSIADFLSQCSEDEIPEWLRSACWKTTHFCTLDIETFELIWGNPLTGN